MTGAHRKNKPGPWILVYIFFLYFYRRAEPRTEPWIPQPAHWLHAYCMPVAQPPFTCSLCAKIYVCGWVLAPAYSSPTHTIHAYSIYISMYSCTYHTHILRHKHWQLGHSFSWQIGNVLLSSTQQKQEPWLQTLINKVERQKENFSLVTQPKEKQYSH